MVCAMPKLRSLFVLLLASLAASLAAAALAQETWFETGTLTTTIGGQERVLHTYGTLVPEDVADGVEDPQQRALLERIAGTEQHTGSYMYMEQIEMVGMVISPAKVWVALTFRFGGPEPSGTHGVTLQFPLDPATLELLDMDEVEITYYPNGSSYDDYYALTEGELVLGPVEVVDDVTLRITGSFGGYLTHQTEWDVVHDPVTAVEVVGEFLVERVVGSSLALDLIEEGQ